MPGLQAAPEEETLFEAPRAGRIAESVATGSVAVEDVYKFYRASLPQLGWKNIDERTWRRDHERLRIDARADGGRTTVRMSVKPE